MKGKLQRETEGEGEAEGERAIVTRPWWSMHVLLSVLFLCPQGRRQRREGKWCIWTVFRPLIPNAWPQAWYKGITALLLACRCLCVSYIYSTYCILYGYVTTVLKCFNLPSFFAQMKYWKSPHSSGIITVYYNFGHICVIVNKIEN